MRGLVIPESSDDCTSEDEEIVKGMGRMQQPIHMIKTILSQVTDKAWEIISERETIQRTEQTNRRVPVLKPTGKHELPTRTNCLACSEDHSYLFLGHSHGLSVIRTSCFTCVGMWQNKRVEITSISCTYIGDSVCLLSTVDDMGVARLFAFCAESIHLIKVINDTEDITQRQICVKFEVSKNGDFGAATINYKDSVLLDVYRFPKDMWLKELEALQGNSQKTASSALGAGESKLSPITLLMKLKPPEVPTGSSLKSPFEVLQKTEEATVIGLGQNHLITSRQWEDQDAIFRNVFKKYLHFPKQRSDKNDVRPSLCTWHFLFPVGFPTLLEAKASPDVSIALCMWWGGSHNLLQYQLLKPPKEKTDCERKPDVVWPNAQEILCSAVSRCTRYVAVGLEGQLLTIWDRHLGSPYATVAVPSGNALCGLRIRAHAPPAGPSTSLCQEPAPCKIHVLLSCKDGTSYTITAGRGVDTHVTILSERPSDPGCFPSCVESVGFPQNLVLVMQRNGSVCLRASVDGGIVCSLSVAEDHKLSSPWEPVFLLEPALGPTLYIKGDKTKRDVLEEGEAKSSLFIFNFSEFSGTDPLEVPQMKPPRSTTSSIEETCNLYIQERACSVEERNRVMETHWTQQQQHAMELTSAHTVKKLVQMSQQEAAGRYTPLGQAKHLTLNCVDLT